MAKLVIWQTSTGLARWVGRFEQAETSVFCRRRLQLPILPFAWAISHLTRNRRLESPPTKPQFLAVLTISVGRFADRAEILGQTGLEIDQVLPVPLFERDLLGFGFGLDRLDQSA